MVKSIKCTKKKYRGVTKYKDGWIAQLSHNGIIHKSKTFKKSSNAAKSYDRFAKRYHKNNAILNFKHSCIVKNIDTSEFHSRANSASEFHSRANSASEFHSRANSASEFHSRANNASEFHSRANSAKKRKHSKKSIRKIFSIVTRNKICSNQRWCCNICKNTLGSIFIIDHIIPLFLGGTNDEYNLQSLCPECERYKTAVIDYKILLPLSKERVLKVRDVLQSQNNNLWRLKCVNPKTMLNNSDLMNTNDSSNNNKKIIFKLLDFLLD